jgi:5-methylcytosine-specific restriction enzyme subunit McrC
LGKLSTEASLAAVNRIDKAVVTQVTIKTNQTLTLFEYEVTDSLTDKDIRVLNRLSPSSGVEILRPVIRQGKICFQARQFVGIVRLGHRTLQILPKMHWSEERDASTSEAGRNLLWMLDYVGHLSIKETDLAALQKAQDWFEILIYFFATHLNRQWLKGTPRTYQAIDAVLPVLKGKWRIPAQMRRPEQKHRFAVTYDEFTTDNPLNQIFRYIVELLWKLTRDSNNRQLLSDLRYWMDEVTLLPAIALQDAQKVRLTRLNQQYEPLLNLALLFLQNLGLELSANDQTAFAFLFDMNQLFEGFLTGFLQRHRREILPEVLSDCLLLPQGRQVVCHLAQYEDRKVFRLKPDLVFRDRDNYP